MACWRVFGCSCRPRALPAPKPWSKSTCGSAMCFSIVVALVTGVLSGLWPAWQLSRPALAQMMQSNTRRTAGSVRRPPHASQLLISGQIALTLLLLASAGAAMQEFSRLLHVPSATTPITCWSSLCRCTRTPTSPGPSARPISNSYAPRSPRLQGVTAAAIAPNATPPYTGWEMHFDIQGRTAPEQQNLSMNLVSPEYFGALGVPVLHGRLWTGTESRNAAPVAVINRTLAR